MNDLTLFKTHMRSLEKAVKPVNVKLTACNDHVYYRARERNIAWTDVYRSLKTFLKYHLCELLFQLHLNPVSTVIHETKEFSLVLGLFDNTIVLRTVLTKDMKTNSTKDKLITYM